MVWQCTTCGAVNENRHYEPMVECLTCGEIYAWEGDRKIIVAAIMVGGSK